MMHRDLVDDRAWIDEPQFLQAVNFCTMLPGPEAQQVATYIGWRLHGLRGALTAGTLFVLPSIFLLLGLSLAYAHGSKATWVSAVLVGLRPVVIALVVAAVHRMWNRSLTQGWQRLIASLSFVVLMFRLPFPLVLVAAAVAAFARSRWKHLDDSRSSIAPGGGPTAPAAARLRPATVAAVAVTLWVIPYAVLRLIPRAPDMLRELYLFFTGAAFVTFGGAYAVLAYTAQHATATGWLTPVALVDGLALAEATPGPLIIVLQFIGFQAAWNAPGVLSPNASAVAGALLTSWVTFLPSITLVLLLAPAINRLNENPRLRTVVAGVTAAAVGMIANLGVSYAKTVWDGTTSPVALAAFTLCCGIAVWALIRWKLSPVKLIALGIVAGPILHLL